MEDNESDAFDLPISMLYCGQVVYNLQGTIGPTVLGHSRKANKTERDKVNAYARRLKPGTEKVYYGDIVQEFRDRPLGKCLYITEGGS